jgi:ABC-type lipoprotein release transport system permease subunit
MVAGVLDRFVYGVSPADPLVWGSVVLLLTGSALLASLVPALRAARSDPLATLRTE